jgi:NAD(P)H-hydrate repair Nnr-like enzyme with NAD(P)H-hydrate dehydratase domain
MTVIASYPAKVALCSGVLTGVLLAAAAQQNLLPVEPLLPAGLCGAFAGSAAHKNQYRAYQHNRIVQRS